MIQGPRGWNWKLEHEIQTFDFCINYTKVKSLNVCTDRSDH